MRGRRVVVVGGQHRGRIGTVVGVGTLRRWGSTSRRHARVKYWVVRHDSGEEMTIYAQRWLRVLEETHVNS
jgi:hypothetical protein